MTSEHTAARHKKQLGEGQTSSRLRLHSSDRSSSLTQCVMAHPGVLSRLIVYSSVPCYRAVSLLLILCLSIHPVASTRSHTRTSRYNHPADTNSLDQELRRRQLVGTDSPVGDRHDLDQFSRQFRKTDSRVSDRQNLDHGRRQLLREAGSRANDRHDFDQRRRQLYEADAAIRALHHHHLPSGSGGGGGGGSGSYASMEEEAFSSSLCWSVSERRYYQSPFSTTTRMSDALFEAIQRYTKMHAACTGPVADWPAFFNDPTQGLSSGASADAVADCKYLLWQEPTWNGLGNQLLSLVSSFIYALLTHRALLISPAAFSSRLLCSPFPHSSWRPPSLSAEDFDLMSAVAKNHMVGRTGMDDGARGEGQQRPTAAFSDLSCRANVSDLAFYCSKVQRQISAVRFLGLDTEEYILPALYFVPEFDQELERLFPDRLPLMHVARYLLHPANYLWEEITRAFRAYLAPYQLRVGIQIRDFTSDTVDEPHVIQRTMQCAVNITRGLPPLLEHSRWKSIMNDETTPSAMEQQWLDPAPHRTAEGSSTRSIGVLVASLKRTYQDAIHDAYVEGVPLGGYDVAVTSLSHESGQTYGEERQLELALKEMWLLSMCDLLLVSDSSTFGYMAAGLAGVSPFSLNVVRRMNSDWDGNGRPECEITTPEPCYLSMLEPQQQQIQCPGESPKSPLDISPKVKYCPNFNIGVVLDVPNPKQYESFKRT